AALTAPGAASLPPRGEVGPAQSARPGGENHFADYTPEQMDASISIAGIQDAASVIDPVFRHTPQFVCEPLSERLGVTTVLKVETINPIRSFKGRGTDYLLHRLGPHPDGLVCASAGNFGQGMAYAARKRGVRMTVFAALSANPLKVDRMRALGATVVLEGNDFDEAKDAAVQHAARAGAFYVEDGLLGPIGEGAGTVAYELEGMDEPLDACIVPLGNGALVNEPAGAAGTAAVAKRRDELAGKRVAVPLTGGNVTEEQLRKYLY